MGLKQLDPAVSIRHAAILYSGQGVVQLLRHSSRGLAVTKHHGAVLVGKLPDRGDNHGRSGTESFCNSPTLNTIKNLALTIAAIGVLPKGGASGLDMGQFLLHSLGTATIARDPMASGTSSVIP